MRNRGVRQCIGRMLAATPYRMIVRRALILLDVIAAVASVLGGLTAVALFSVSAARSSYHVVPEIDTYGYTMMAKSFAAGQWPRWNDDFGRFRGHVWVDTGNGQVMAKYPPGWPALLAVGYRANGLEGALRTNTVLAVIGAVAFFLLVILLFGPAACPACCAMWLFSPLLVFYSTYPLSHSADITFVMLAMLLAAAWGRWQWTALAFLAGLCLGFLPAIRPTSILIWPAALLLATGVKHQRWRQLNTSSETSRWLLLPMRMAWRDVRARRWWRFVRQNRGAITLLLGMAAMLLPLAIYNTVSFGAPWRTGYGLTGEQTAFDFTDWRRRLWSLEYGRLVLLGALAWGMGLAGFVLRARGSAIAWALATWFVPIVGLYLGYYWWLGPQASYFRFVLSVAPAWVLGAGFLFQPAAKAGRPVTRAVLVAVSLWLAWVTVGGADQLHAEQVDVSSLTAILNQLKAPLPPSSPQPWTSTIAELAGKNEVAVFGTGADLWTAGSVPGVTGYDLNGWTDLHFTRPMESNFKRDEGILADPRHHRRLHEKVNALAATGGLPADFDRRIATLDTAGATLVIMADRDDPLFARITPTHQFAQIGQTDNGMPVFRVTKRL